MVGLRKFGRQFTCKLVMTVVGSESTNSVIIGEIGKSLVGLEVDLLGDCPQWK